MEYRRLGNTGLKVSALSYGAWTTFKTQADLKQAKEMIRACVDAGVNFFDNAEVYADGEAEVIMGQAIKELGLKRSDLVLSTKIFWGGPGPNDRGLSRKHVIEGTQAALSRLQTSYVDLLFCHRPDPDTPIEETVRAMNHCLDRGWALYWGTSEWSAEQIKQARAIAVRLGLQPPVMEQPEYNLFERHKVESDYAPLYDSEPGLGLTVWSPLASGILTGKYGGGGGGTAAPAGSRLSMEEHKAKLDSRAHHIAAAERLKPLAAELGCSPAQLALAWTLTNPRVSTTITGASKVEQVRDNMGALAVLPKLTPQLVQRLEHEIAQALVEAEQAK
ncbi:hypothetical protein CHLRE_04g217916v5 [Chlamydomonas reinhardtii]|uniref:NADP-dependent oxidoreductase domain-containing protein n=1 Tax=Chlamydomonas reinhardtii TaxID=3055 RepID=A0A2K3DTE7_CHLRE|nr:uncharacterized protein CHLRE_04g217916v5 [Chlamydomonas reinhardtii]XP_042925007.1 uncharacterized protein CHLRE_04g217916v5 [Chlamydomonas reinhardtii]PNW83810.1 hypothetical protein CHLRE_04g217916v5 [Chlamydomonas reinhardtii]PNW83811.1 hypothetical protein CHLRE_04g217916v5 [Chlamydomonas reinhardtii]